MPRPKSIPLVIEHQGLIYVLNSKGEAAFFKECAYSDGPADADMWMEHATCVGAVKLKGKTASTRGILNFIKQREETAAQAAEASE